MKNIFLGKSPKSRAYAPKILEHLYIIFGDILISMCMFFIVYSYINQPKGKFIDVFFNLLNQISIKIVLALILGFWITIVINSIRIIRIISKTEQAKLLVYFEIIGSLLIITTPLTIVFGMASFKYNEIVYE